MKEWQTLKRYGSRTPAPKQITSRERDRKDSIVLDPGEIQVVARSILVPDDVVTEN